MDIEEETKEINITPSGYAHIEIKRGKSIIIIGDSDKGGTDVRIEVSTKFNWLQKRMWRYLLNIRIEDVKED